MCDERERLIEYVYGEGEVEDRKRVEAHLEDCHVCRAEVTGLRGVRDDLLAWDVPKSAPIWRPFVAAPAVVDRPSWSSWALAAAAGALFTAGLAGGMAARGWVLDAGSPASTVAAVQVGDPARTQADRQPVTPEDLARLETAILSQVRAEVAAQLKQVPGAPTAVNVRSGDRRDDLEVRLAVIEDLMGDQIRLNNIFNSKFGSLSTRTSNLSERLEMSRFQNVSLDGGVR